MEAIFCCPKCHKVNRYKPDERCRFVICANCKKCSEILGGAEHATIYRLLDKRPVDAPVILSTAA